MAMIKKVTDKINYGDLAMIRIEEIPKGSNFLPGVCKMKRKRDTKIYQIKKWKARLNVYGSRMNKGIQYDKVNSLVAGWPSIRILLILLSIEGCNTMQVD